jgi:flagellar biosynthetic protein FlhB
MGMMAVFALVSSIVQVGFLYNEEALEPNLEKINPLSGLQRMFSMRSLAEGIKSLLKLILVSAVVWFLFKDELARLPHLSQLSVEEIMSYAGELAFRGFVSAQGVVFSCEVF